MDQMVDALSKEIKYKTAAWKPILQGVDTIYFGGGTPSLLGHHQIRELLSAIYTNYLVPADAEITLEANPDDITAEKLQDWKDLGINRLSVGVQSFFDQHLTWMNRAHNAREAIETIALIRSAGFENFSVDLIYGIPGMTEDEWLHNIKTITSKRIPHVACYALTVEPGTALSTMIRNGKRHDVNPNVQSEHFITLMNELRKAGYSHYEISNFALPGFESKHNSSYWTGEPYLGIGPSAHSFHSNIRSWNISNNALYIKSVEQDRFVYEEETLTWSQRLNEQIMTGLRTNKGFALPLLKNILSSKAWKVADQNIQKLLSDQKAVVIDDHLILTDQGKFFADGIAANLFTTDDDIRIN